jgi:hypothetical protein
MDEQTMGAMRQSAVPWWAAFGAPLLGVPIMVGLLALGSPGTTSGVGGPVEESPFTTEQAEQAPIAEDDWVEVVAAPVVPAGPRC